ncbi:hypothetical protein MKX01_033959, partial [Papaver californicum]
YHNLTNSDQSRRELYFPGFPFWRLNAKIKAQCPKIPPPNFVVPPTTFFAPSPDSSCSAMRSCSTQFEDISEKQ